MRGKETAKSARCTTLRRLREINAMHNFALPADISPPLRKLRLILFTLHEQDRKSDITGARDEHSEAGLRSTLQRDAGKPLRHYGEGPPAQPELLRRSHRL